jgi:hypothetical protein
MAATPTSSATPGTLPRVGSCRVSRNWLLVLILATATLVVFRRQLPDRLTSAPAALWAAAGSTQSSTSAAGVPASVVNIIRDNDAFFPPTADFVFEFEPYGEAKLFRGVHLHSVTTPYQLRQMRMDACVYSLMQSLEFNQMCIFILCPCFSISLRRFSEWSIFTNLHLKATCCF